VVFVKSFRAGNDRRRSMNRGYFDIREEEEEEEDWESVFEVYGTRYTRHLVTVSRNKAGN
jgi:hypothetical protein